jgi:hypothetical protein
MIKYIFIVIGLLLLIIIIPWLLKSHDLFWNSFWNPKEEQVRREVFEQTKSYKQGMIQDLRNMQFEYVQAKPEHKSALRSIILHRSADFHVSDLPSDLQTFLSSLKVEQ